jgi:peptidoglycan hydrolase CwlO-like protein
MRTKRLRREGRRLYMKKKLVLCGAFMILTLGLVACGKKQENVTTATNPVEPYENKIDDINSQVSEDYEEMDNVMDNLDEY